jgi:hypothetical protein
VTSARFDELISRAVETLCRPCFRAWWFDRGLRDPLTIDPETRDIGQNVYIRRVGRKDGELYNVEFDVFPAVKDPAKAKAQ